MPVALLAQIVNYITLAAKAAPQLEAFYNDAKAFFQNLFSSGLITKATQDALMTWANAHQAAVLAGTVPPEFTVEA